jgi:DNA end-binding protein Ku
MLGITLRYPYEVREQADYFADIEDEKVPERHARLALHIVDTNRGDFEPEKFKDQYEDALKDLLERKRKGEKIERPKEPSRSNVVNLMDALRQSVQGEKRSSAAKKGRKRIEGQKELLLPIQGKKRKEADSKSVARPSGRQKKTGSNPSGPRALDVLTRDRQRG